MPPATLAGPLLRYLVGHLVRDARDGGAVALPGLTGYLRELADAAAEQVADDGHDHDDSDKLRDMITVAELAEMSGYPTRTLRRWAAGGRLRARRAGRTWLVDPESLKGI